MMVHEEMWRAIVNCDVSYDGRFYYVMVSTGNFRRPSCKSKSPKREHVRVSQRLRLSKQWRQDSATANGVNPVSFLPEK